MPEWITKLNEIGPEKIVHVYDPEVGMKGVVVIDSTLLGGAAGGGIRMMPDVTTDEVCGLARAMTYKFSAVGLPIGGAKSGIWADPSIKGDERTELMKSFGRAIKPLLQTGLTVGADIGTDAADLAVIYEGAEVPWSSTGLVMEEKDGEPLENHATGYGVVVAARAACDFVGIDMAGASAAIEGFGKVGGGVARYLTELGAKVTAVSTINGTIYNEDGLDVEKLLADRKTMGDRAVDEYSDAKHFAREEIYTLPVDIMIPGARPYVIDKDNAADVKARVISSIANIPITDEAEEILFKNGVHVVPDFICNAGGITIAVIDILGGDADKVFTVLDDLLYSLSKDILADAKKEGVNPRALSMQRTTEKVLETRKRAASISFEEALDIARKQFNM